MQQETKRRGCFGTGCIVVLVLFALVAIALVAGIYLLVNNASQLARLAEENPTTFAESHASAAEIEVAQKKVESVLGRTERGEEFSEKITQREFNLYLAGKHTSDNEPNFNLELHPGEATVKFSIPFSEKPESLKYFNGAAQIAVEIQNGILRASLKDLKLRDQELPWLFQKLLGAVAQQMDDGLMQQREDLHLSSFDTLTIAEGEVTVHAKKGPPLADSNKAVGPSPEPAPERAREKVKEPEPVEGAP